MLQGQMPVREDVLGGVFEQRRGTRKARAQAIGDLAELRERRRMVGLGEDGPDDSRQWPHARPGDRVGRRGVEIRDSRARPKVDEVKTAPIRSWPRVGGAGMSTSVVRPRPLVFCLDCGSGYDGMSTRELADYWGCPPARITRWCRCRLLPATLTTHGWRIQPGARRPWMDGPMALQWRRTTRSGMTRVEQESLVSRMTASTAATVHSWRPLSQITVISRQMAFLLGTRGPIR